MDLVLCHTTADFDTLGAAVGLTLLYPGLRIVLAGGAHPAVRDFLALHRDEYALIERRAVNPARVRRLFVVDTQRRDRLGKTAEWLDLPGVEVTVYDHHPTMVSDISARVMQVEAIGATTTLIVEALQAQTVVPNAMEATVMALGIHVDTGSLTFDHTTVRDARALTWLMEHQANIRTISEYVDPGLPLNLQEILAIALDNLQTQTIQGYRIASVLLPLDAFTPGLSSVAGRLMEITEAEALLLAAEYCRSRDCQTQGSEADRITLIGRSQIEGTDLNQLLAPLGGGGHARAAAANLREGNAQAILETLVKQLIDQIPHPPLAREIMSAPVRTIRPETTIAEAQRILLRYGHSGLSVVDASDQLVGVISRRDLDIALHHGFSHAPVKGYMTTNLHTITPETSLPEIEALMVTYDIGRLPVLAGERLVGIVTRTDVLRQLHWQSNGQIREKSQWRENLEEPEADLPEWARLTSAQRLNAVLEALVPELKQLLMAAATAAASQGWQLYLVGGGVRDFLLKLAANGDKVPEKLLLQDIDLVVDGFHQTATTEAGVALARSLQTLYPEARLEIHGKFQTAALLWHSDPVLQSLWVDIATARTEFYPYPAANPEVEASSIQQDLYRRDFTINAMALRLTPPRAGELLDFFGGALDLQAKRIRVLHANSFIEDPTRIYRAVRFAVRLGFEIEPQTEGYIRHAIASGIYQQVQDQQAIAPALQTRLRAELKSILSLPAWETALRQLANLGALGCIHPTLENGNRLWRPLRLLARFLKHQNRQASSLSLPTLPGWLWLLEAMLAQLPPEARAPAAENLQLPQDSIERLRLLAQAEATLSTLVSQNSRDPRPSQVVKQLQAYDPALLVLLMVGGDPHQPDHTRSRPARRLLWRYLTHWIRITAPLDGNDLKNMGYKPGPQFRQILETLRAATLDGEIHDKVSAQRFLTEWFPLSRSPGET